VGVTKPRLPRLTDARPGLSSLANLKPENHSAPPLDAARFGVLGTPLPITSYAELTKVCQEASRRPTPFALEFTNTHIVIMRRCDPGFRDLTSEYDYFISDSTPLTWCLNLQGAKMRDRVYGPAFMRECITNTPGEFSHYLLGGSPECGARLREVFKQRNPAVRFIGSWHGNCLADGTLEGRADREVVEEINRLSPDFIWVAFGDTKQVAWVKKHKHLLRRGVVLTVGFAFDSNAGTKPDAPMWMQRLGLTWLFRLATEPRRLASRYFKYNSLFLFYLLWDGLRGRAFAKSA